MRGKFISIDGTEGSGKSTQIKLIADYLNARNISTYTSREPGGTQLGEAIRSLLLSDDYEPDVDSELLLIMAARNEHIKKELLPRLENNQWIICDRFNDATFSYQGYGRGIDNSRIFTLENWLQPNLLPDLSLLLTLPLSQAQDRVEKRALHKDRIENQTPEFFQRVHQGYQARCQLSHVKVIDASQTIEDTFTQIAQQLETLIQR